MWIQPRKTVKAIIEKDVSFGIMLIATIFSIENFFFYAYLYSLGLRFDTPAILAIAFIVGLIYGRIWISIFPRMFLFIEHLYKKTASLEEIRVAVIWSKVPAIGILLSWIGIIWIEPRVAFIEIGGGNPYTVLLHLANVLFAIWSMVLLIFSLQAVESLNIKDAIKSAIFAWIIFSIPVIALIVIPFYFLRL